MLRTLRKASLAAIFAFCLSFTSLSACDLDKADAYGLVQRVYDGDSLQLASGEKVRIIGLNAPERERDGRPAQTFAHETRDALRRFLQKNENRVLLRYDQQRHDRHGRLLAHVYSINKQSVSVELLRNGYAAWLVVPPNTWNLDCYRKAEMEARAVQRGIWSLPKGNVLDASAMSVNDIGFKLVQGRVREIKHTTHSTWWYLDQLSVRIDEEDADNFSGLDVSKILNRPVIVRGWVYAYGGRPAMRLRHPAMLEFIQ